MLSIDARSNADSAKRYYLTDKEYHAQEEVAAPEWGGQGAKIFKLEGEVDPKHFARLCDNRYPKGTGENAKKKLCPRESKDRRVLYDASFHPPKSVSLAWELGGDNRVLEAFQKAVRDTMKEVETFASVRTRKDGKVCDQQTGVMTHATFWHGLSRPVNGKPSPHLHAHCCILAHTYDPAKGKFLALQIGTVKAQAPALQETFHKKLRDNLRSFGYETRKKGKSWELCGVPESAIKKFSERNTLIEKVAAVKGLTGKRKHMLGLSTREPKAVELDKKSLMAEWFSRLTDREVGCFQRLAKSTTQEKPKHRWLDRAREIIQRVHVSEREAYER